MQARIRGRWDPFFDADDTTVGEHERCHIESIGEGVLADRTGRRPVTVTAHIGRHADKANDVVPEQRASRWLDDCVDPRVDSLRYRAVGDDRGHERYAA